MRLSLILAVFCLLLPAALIAQNTPGDAAFRGAFQAAKRGDHDAAQAAVAAMDPVARDLILWMRLRDGQGTLDQALAFAGTHPEWPEQTRIRREAEALLTPQTPADQVLRLLGDHRARTPAGLIAQVAALRQVGRADAVPAALRNAWPRMSLTKEQQARAVDGLPDLTPELHRLRADQLLYRGRAAEARQMLPLLPDDLRALTEARLAVIAGAGDAGARIKALPGALAQDPGLAYARFDRFAATGRYSKAIALLRERSTSAEALGEPLRWSGWRRSLARRTMREGAPLVAYELASKSYTTPEDGYNHADLQWLSGFIALQYLGAPDLAQEHFETFLSLVETPISLGRGWYWLAQAQAARGDDAASQMSLAMAAEHQTSFYGLLAAERLGMALDPALTHPVPAVDWRRGGLARQPMARAVDLLLTAGQPGYAYYFIDPLGDALDPDLTRAAIAMLLERDAHFLALRLAKRAVRRGIMIPEGYFPLHPLAAESLPVEPALSLAIARQESEFRVGASSPVGAQGLMQLMPGTAREMSRKLGLAYNRRALSTDWRYNARLGSAYLAELTERFGDSPVLLAAGYNAGPGRVYEWIAVNGDPRDPGVDPVIWIERIPFRETRNYVQRVSEALPLYRARLGGGAQPVAFTPLLEGLAPRLRPRPRPAPRVVADPEAATVPRPLARPVGAGN